MVGGLSTVGQPSTYITVVLPLLTTARCHQARSPVVNFSSPTYVDNCRSTEAPFA
jgi:hypothetical protein